MAHKTFRNILLTTSALCLLAVAAPDAQARVTRIVIEKKTSPAFNGATFGAGRAI